MLELEAYGNIPYLTEKSGKRGRPGKAYHLNEAQALLVCKFSRTPTAAAVRKLLIETFSGLQGRTPNALRDRQDCPAELREPRRGCSGLGEGVGLGCEKTAPHHSKKDRDINNFSNWPIQGEGEDSLKLAHTGERGITLRHSMCSSEWMFIWRWRSVHL